MTDHEPAAAAGEPVDELKRTIALMLEHDRKGYDIQNLLFHAQKLADKLVDNPAVSVVAGYQMKDNARVFYPAEYKPTDTENFRTVIYANGDEQEPAAPHYVLRYVDHVGGALGKKHALVSVSDWNAGMSQQVAEQVCDENGRPLEVYPRPIIAQALTAVSEPAPCN